MLNSIVFFDKNKKFIESYEQILKDIIPNCSFICSDLKTLIATHKNINALVSPANSYGYMNGGIYMYIDEILKIESSVKKMIEMCGNNDDGLRKYLPVGRCEMVKTDNKNNNNHNIDFLFVVPTMTTPKSIQNTNNVYIAFLSFLNKLSSLQNIVVACPCMGTGVGMMSPEESSEQIKNAYQTFVNNSQQFNNQQNCNNGFYCSYGNPLDGTLTRDKKFFVKRGTGIHRNKIIIKKRFSIGTKDPPDYELQ